MSQSDRPKRRWLRRALFGASLVPVSALGLWVAIHHVPGLGPFLADSARAVVGPEAIAKLEDFAYDLQDRYEQYRHKDELPQAAWDVPSSPPALPSATALASASGSASAVAAPSASAPVPVGGFRPADVPPMIPSFAAPGDGQWVPALDPRRPDEPPRMYKTLLHPDKSRSYAAVFVVAIDLKQVQMHAVAGRSEPTSTTRDGMSYDRKAIIPAEAQESLLAAFNGGFKEEHGHFGMRVDGVTLVRPRPKMCTIAQRPDGLLAVRSWEQVGAPEDALTWFRQTPPCMVEEGQLHQALKVEGNTAWGCALDGKTVIRRSAVGLSQDGQTLFVGMGESTTARAIALAMAHAGSYNVAQLDVNYSFPRFLFFEPKEPGSKDLIPKPLAPAFEYSQDDYIRRRAQRDFFYLTRKSTPGQTASASP